MCSACRLVCTTGSDMTDFGILLKKSEEVRNCLLQGDFSSTREKSDFADMTMSGTPWTRRESSVLSRQIHVSSLHIM
jgi:hypothetical protein